MTTLKARIGLRNLRGRGSLAGVPFSPRARAGLFVFVSGCFRPAAGSRFDMGVFVNGAAVGAPLFGMRGRVTSPAPASRGQGTRNASSFSHSVRSYEVVGSCCAGSLTDDSAPSRFVCCFDLTVRSFAHPGRMYSLRPSSGQADDGGAAGEKKRGWRKVLGGATMGTEGERFLTAFGMTTLGQGGEKQVPHPATRSGAQTARSVPFEAQGKRDDNVKSAGRAAQPSRMRRFCGWPVFASGEGRAFCFVSGCFRPAAGSRLDMGMFANRSAVGAPLFGIRGRIKSPAPAEPGAPEHILVFSQRAFVRGGGIVLRWIVHGR